MYGAFSQTDMHVLQIQRYPTVEHRIMSVLGSYYAIAI